VQAVEIDPARFQMLVHNLHNVFNVSNKLHSSSFKTLCLLIHLGVDQNIACARR
jgi:pheromone shutdown protein TraB